MIKKIVCAAIIILAAFLLFVNWGKKSKNKFANISTATGVEGGIFDNGKEFYINEYGKIIINDGNEEYEIRPLNKDGHNSYLSLFPYCALKNDIYYVVVRDSGLQEIYRYNTNSKCSEKIYEIVCQDEEQPDYISAISCNGTELLLVLSNKIDMINIKSMIRKTLISLDETEYIAIYENKIYIANPGKPLKEYSINNGKLSRLEGVYSNYIYISKDGIIYYSDMKNGGMLSEYDLNTGIKKEFKTDAVLGFIENKNDIYVEYYKEKKLISEYT